MGKEKDLYTVQDLIKKFNIKVNFPKKYYNTPLSEKLNDGELTVDGNIYRIDYIEDNDETVYTVIIDVDRRSLDISMIIHNRISGVEFTPEFDDGEFYG